MSDFEASDVVPDWQGIPEELPDPEKEFMRKNRLAFSSAYLGMLRCYHDDPADECRYARTIWPSSSGISVVACAAFAEPGKPFLPPGHAEALKQAGREFLAKLMGLPDYKLIEVLNSHVPLF